MKTYYSLDTLINDMDNLENETVFISKNVEYEANKLEQYLFKSLKKRIRDKHIVLKVLKEEQFF